MCSFCVWAMNYLTYGGSGGIPLEWIHVALGLIYAGHIQTGVNNMNFADGSPPCLMDILLAYICNRYFFILTDIIKAGIYSS